MNHLTTFEVWWACAIIASIILFGFRGLGILEKRWRAKRKKEKENNPL